VQTSKLEKDPFYERIKVVPIDPIVAGSRRISGGMPMLKSIEGIYRDGKIELSERPAEPKEARVIVTFLAPDGPVDLQSRGLSIEMAADLRSRLRAFAQDWERPDMDVYDAH
jgi:hypothetical protein